LVLSARWVGSTASKTRFVVDKRVRYRGEEAWPGAVVDNAALRSVRL